MNNFIQPALTPSHQNAFVTACQIQRDLKFKVPGGYTDLFPKVCTDSIRSRHNKISFNKRYLQEYVYKEHNKYIESELNLRVNEDINFKSIIYTEAAVQRYS